MTAGFCLGLALLAGLVIGYVFGAGDEHWREVHRRMWRGEPVQGRDIELLKSLPPGFPDERQGSQS